jgi:hypothetical protein
MKVMRDVPVLTLSGLAGLLVGMALYAFHVPFFILVGISIAPIIVWAAYETANMFEWTRTSLRLTEMKGANDARRRQYPPAPANSIEQTRAGTGVKEDHPSSSGGRKVARVVQLVASLRFS